MQTADILILSTAMLLAVWLVIRVWRRTSLRRASENQWTGHGIDVSAVAKRMERVRHNFAAELGPSSQISRRRGLLALARRAVARFAYFRDRNAESAEPTKQC